MCGVRIARFPLTLLFLVLPLSVAAPQARSQQEGTGQDTAQVQPAPAVIPVPAIPQRADAARGDLRAARDRLARSDAVRTTIEALSAFTEALTSTLEDPAFRPGEGASLRTLDGIRRRWTPFQVRLDEWKRTLDPQAQSLGEERDSLLQTRRLWERTRAAAVE